MTTWNVLGTAMDISNCKDVLDMFDFWISPLAEICWIYWAAGIFSFKARVARDILNGDRIPGVDSSSYGDKRQSSSLQGYGRYVHQDAPPKARDVL